MLAHPAHVAGAADENNSTHICHPHCGLPTGCQPSLLGSGRRERFGRDGALAEEGGWAVESLFATGHLSALREQVRKDLASRACRKQRPWVVPPGMLTAAASTWAGGGPGEAVVEDWCFPMPPSAISGRQ